MGGCPPFDGAAFVPSMPSTKPELGARTGAVRPLYRSRFVIGREDVLEAFGDQGAKFWMREDIQIVVTNRRHNPPRDFDRVHSGLQKRGQILGTFLVRCGFRGLLAKSRGAVSRALADPGSHKRGTKHR